MSGILNRKKMLTKFLWGVPLRWQIYPDILNGKFNGVLTVHGVQEEHCWTKRNAIDGVKLTIFS